MVYGQQFLDSFQFDNYTVFHQQVYFVAAIESKPFESHWKSKLPFVTYFAQAQLVT